MEGGNGNGLLEQEECLLTINEGMSVGMYNTLCVRVALPREEEQESKRRIRRQYKYGRARAAGCKRWRSVLNRTARRSVKLHSTATRAHLWVIIQLSSFRKRRWFPLRVGFGGNMRPPDLLGSRNLRKGLCWDPETFAPGHTPRAEARPTGRAVSRERLGDWEGPMAV
jgi:hypothetical protein